MRGEQDSQIGLLTCRTGLGGIAVGTALDVNLGPPPARIRAGGITALGSCLGSWRRSVPRDVDVDVAGRGATAGPACSSDSSRSGRAGLASEERGARRG